MLTSFYSYNWKYPETSRTHSPPQSIHILLKAPRSITLSRHECSMVLPLCMKGNALSAIRATSSRKHILDMMVYPFIKEEGLLIEGSVWNWRCEDEKAGVCYRQQMDYTPSPLLSKPYNGRINVDFCSSVKIIHYINEYISKSLVEPCLDLRIPSVGMTWDSLMMGRYISSDKAI